LRHGARFVLLSGGMFGVMLSMPRAVHVRDFVATRYHALGYGPETQVVGVLGRSHFIVPGNPLLELF
jgi:hypothetical protein